MSMTGYGKYVQVIDNTSIHVEIRTLNNRFFDFSPSIPRFVLPIEGKIKKVVQTYFFRGSIEFQLNIESSSLAEKQLVVDWKLMDQYIDQIKQMKSRYNLSGDIPIETIMNLSDLFTVQEIENEQSEQLTKEVLKTVQLACEQVRTVRKKEGAFIAQDIKMRMDSINSTILLIKKRQGKVTEQYRERIHNRINDYLQGYSQIDEQRIHQEITLLAEKGDITEEIIRLLSHNTQFVSTLNEQTEIGRKLDFIIQEMHREINTIGAKSIDTKISEWTVLLKTNLEKVREQVQNIE